MVSYALLAQKAEGYDVMALILLPIVEAVSGKMDGADPFLLSKAVYALGTLLRSCQLCQQVFLCLCLCLCYVCTR